MTYGYRYSPTSPVFELPGHTRATATEVVTGKRVAQERRGGTATAELVTNDTGTWTPIPLPLTARALRRTESAPDRISDLLGVIPTKPRTGRRRR